MDSTLSTVTISALVSIICAVISSTISFKVHTYMAEKAANKARLYASLNFFITIVDNDSFLMQGTLANCHDMDILPTPLSDLPIKITMDDIATNFKFYPSISRHFLHYILQRDNILRISASMGGCINRDDLEKFSHSTEDMLQLLLKTASAQQLEKSLLDKGIYTWTLPEVPPQSDR